MNLGKYDCSLGISAVLHIAGDLTVRTSSVVDVPLIDQLQRDNSYAVGFIQRTIWDRYVFGGERNFFVLIVEANHDAVGYCLVTPGRAPNTHVRIQQIAVRNDARRLHYGQALLRVIRDFCEDNQRVGVRLRCRADLESNLFWRAMGFVCYDVWAKGRVNHVGMKASDDINLWQRDFGIVPSLMLLPEVDEIEPVIRHGAWAAPGIVVAR
jgi:predicted GNAT family N-acyltransferase